MKMILCYLICILIFSSLCNEEDIITVHIVPHTHNDPGWLLTYDKYYLESGNGRISVRRILDNMILSLKNSKDRTFIYVEICFFQRWYRAQPPSVQNQVKDLLFEKRLEFVNGGFVMHDEASSYYQHLIDQMRLGLQFLKKEFNYTPDIAWFIDPFGHSAATAGILSKMGFNKIAIVRVDYQQKDYLIKQKDLEFYWKPFHDNSTIFTHVTYDHYCPPHSLDGAFSDYEVSFSKDNIERMSNAFAEDMKKWNSGYKHKNVLLMYGDDFTFQSKDANFVNIEKIMEYINSNTSKFGLKMEYSTPGKYFFRVLKEVKPSQWTEYQQKDFFPYADQEYSYWTGYFTSRPYLKGIVRETGNYLSTSSKLMMELALRSNQQLENPADNKSLLENAVTSQYYLRERLALCQHHDAVSGTSRQKVSENYENMLTDSIKNIKGTMTTVFNDGFFKMKQKEDIKICLASHVTDFKCNLDFEIISSSTDRKLTMAIYNPNIEGKMMVNIEMNSEDYIYQVYNDNSEIIESNFVCIIEEGFYRYNCLLQFNYNFQKGQAFSTITLKKTMESNKDNKSSLPQGKFTILEDEGSVQLLEFDPASLQFRLAFANQSSYSYSIKHAFYISYNGLNSQIKPDRSNPDGAYVFSPADLNPTCFKLNPERSFVYKGKIGSSIVLRFDQSYLVISVLKDPFMFQLDTIWDPVTLGNNGMNYVLLVQSDIENEVLLPNGQSQPEFWTDSNGTIMLRRFKDYREGYPYIVNEKVAANFYPVNYAISMRDRRNYPYSPHEYEGLTEEDRMITIYNDRAEGGGAMNKGELILIINRYSRTDDTKGLDQGLFEKSSFTTFFKVRHLLAFGTELFRGKDSIPYPQEYIENYFHNIPALFSIPGNPEISSMQIESLLSRLIEKTDNIIVNLQFLKSNRILIQFYNHYDKYFTMDRSKENGFVKLNVRNDIQWNEYEMNGTARIPKKSYFQKFMKDKFEESEIYIDEDGNISFEIFPEGFRLFEIQLK